jgi:hypothetical protein
MTKLISVRVTIPTDDDVTTEDLQLLLRQRLEGAAEPSPAPAAGRRVHWVAVDVRRLVENPPPRRVAKKSPPGALSVVAP